MKGKVIHSKLHAMNSFPKVILSISLCLLALSLFGQNRDYKTALTIGLSTPLLDNGTGFHFAINPIYELGNHFALEGQVSFGHAKIKSSFIAGNKGEMTSFNALIGPRIYILSKERKVRPFLNLLAGGFRLLERSEQFPARNPEYFIGFSTGGYLEIKGFLVGIAYENFGLLILKAGYNF